MRGGFWDTPPAFFSSPFLAAVPAGGMPAWRGVAVSMSKGVGNVNTRLSAWLAAWLVLSVMGLASAQDKSAWAWPRWTPLGGKKPATRPASSSPKQKSVVAFPALMPQFQGGRTARGGTPSKGILSRMADGTKSMFDKTRSALTPWKKDTPNKSRPNYTGFSNSPLPGQGKEKSGVSTWFTKSEPAPKPTTLPDWLALPKPEY